LAEARDLFGKIKQLFRGDKINSTEDRAVLHAALRAARNEVYEVDGVNQTPLVWAVLDKIKDFSETIRRYILIWFWSMLSRCFCFLVEDGLERLVSH
jgi:glucose-6-phosphate isomerase